MPKVGMEPIRRKELIRATIQEIAVCGSLDVTVGKIAKRAGMSSGLAHHYFGGKNQILMAAMRHILRKFQEQMNKELTEEKTPLERVEAIVKASFHPNNFEPEVISAWLSFYVYAQHSAEAQRLLKIYVYRMHSNLLTGLCKLMDHERADETARGVGAMIDGFYIRKSLHSGGTSREKTMQIVCDYVYMQLNREAGR